jgi:hypothetical protein
MIGVASLVRSRLGLSAVVVVGLLATTFAQAPVASAAGPSFSVTPSIAFGPVPVGASSTLAATVTNVSGGTLTNIQIAGGGIIDPDFANFQNCQGATLADGATCQVSYVFAPKSLGVRNLTNNFTLNGEAQSVALTGEGVNGLTASPTSLDFGSLGVGATSAPQVVTITNTSTFTIGNIQMAGGGLGQPTDDFANFQSCQGVTLAPNGTCSVTYLFTPKSLGAKSITNNFTLNTAPFAIGLSGVGVAPNNPPTVDAGGPYSVGEGGTGTVTATGSDPENGPLSYDWDLDNNGSFETPGQSATFSAAALDGPATRTIRVRATDTGGLTGVSTAVVQVANVAPGATFNAPAATFAGFAFALSLTGPNDPSTADTTAGFSYAFDCGSGYGGFVPSSAAACPTSSVGIRTVGGKIRDKDGGTSEYRASVSVVVTYDSLCALTRTLVSKPGVADSLCEKLASAEAAASRGNLKARDATLKEYRSLLDAQAGKSVTAANAALLKSISLSLQ